eukprot:495912-Alexandrium_andersonii.AAC.1
MTSALQNELLNIVSKGRANLSFGEVCLFNVELLAIHFDALIHELGHVVLKDANSIAGDGGAPFLQ